MAHENINSYGLRTCRYAGTDLSAADSNMGQVVRVTAGAGQASDYGYGRPTVAKLAAGSGGSGGSPGDMYGVVQTVEVPSSGSRAPSGTRITSVATKGILKTKKTSDPALTDIGLQVIVDTTTSGAAAGGVNTAALSTAVTPRGIVVGITGTTANDFLLVDWR